MSATTETTATFDGEPAIVLRDDTGAEAWVLPSIGDNCIAFRTQAGGKTVHLLSTPPSLEVFRTRPTFWGYPILSPYPGRHQTPFSWRGRSYEIEPNDRPGVAIHGIVAGAPWEIVEASERALTCRFDSESFPGRPGRWPWPFVLTATHRLEQGALRLDLTLENRSGEEVPHLLGLHPYFPIRTTPAAGSDLPADRPPTAEQLAGGDAAAARETCEVWVAADELWEMNAGLGTGRIERLTGIADLRTPRSVAALERGLDTAALDTPVTAPAGPRLPVLLYGKRGALRGPEAGVDPAERGGVWSGVRDLASGVEVTLESSAGFGALATFFPPDRPFISLEPRSAVSDALTLMRDPRGLPTGVFPLPAGARWQAWARLSAAPLT